MKIKNNPIQVLSMIFSLVVVLISIATSCKKTEYVNAPCNCPSTATPEEINYIRQLYSEGYFVFNKFYTISNHIVVFDSCKSYVRHHPLGLFYEGTLNPSPFYFDSAKVNGVKFTKYYYQGYSDISTNCYATPRHCQMFADTTTPLLQHRARIVDYMDNTKPPTYYGGNLWPDSIKIGKDSVFNIGGRTDMMETEVSIDFVPGTPIFSDFKRELRSNEYTLTVPTSRLQSIGLNYFYLTVYLRNWTFIVIEKQHFCFVCDNRYSKKIKFYN